MTGLTCAFVYINIDVWPISSQIRGHVTPASDDGVQNLRKISTQNPRSSVKIPKKNANNIIILL